MERIYLQCIAWILASATLIDSCRFCTSVQVVDDNSVNKSVKSSKRTKQLQGDILVRHYGSYT
ncbi:hypothetical protein glysoja_049249 [Glycine soja]|uniref:Uncharacterized protein n=1 Tax=Glycine soja TaxID=3848 RepID=A0A0B2SLT5_GLYSO|nr:hypothetical protein glysoja_049249 [Glycine soja]